MRRGRVERSRRFLFMRGRNLDDDEWSKAIFTV